MKSPVKKIAIVFNSLEIGGIENRIVDITNYIAVHHPEIKVTLCLKDPTGDLAKYIPKSIKICFPSQKFPRFVQALRYPFWLRQPLKQTRPDIILCFGNYAAIAGVVAKSLSPDCRRSKLIISEDSSIIEQLHTDSYYRLRSLLVKIAYPLADKIIVLSSAGKKKLLEFVPSVASKTTIFPNWLPFRFSESVSSKAIKQDIDILFLGRFVPQKNPLDFIRIIKLLTQTDPQVKSVMVGYGALQPQMKTLINDLHLQSNLHILPATTSPAKFFKRSKIFLLSSDHEGFPLVLLEANACRCVPVMRYLPEISHYYKPHAKYLFFQTPKKAALLIHQLLHQPRLRRQIADYYYQLVIDNQSKNTKGFIKLIQSVL